jgi:cell division protein FtsX
VIRLGWQLTLNGDKQALARLLVTTVAVGLGVLILLISLASFNALSAQDARSAWLDTQPQGITIAKGTPSLWWLVTIDQYRNLTIDVVDVASTGSKSPAIPGVARLPRPGEYYASPAMQKLLSSAPPDELGDRFDAKSLGTIENVALASPSSLVIVVGQSARELSESGGAKITSLNTATGKSGPGGNDATVVEILLTVVACALLFPLLIFIATATRLAAASREQRFAVMRLIGATPRQISIIAAVESTIAAVAGVVLGFGFYFSLHPLLTRFTLTGSTTFPGELSLRPVDFLGVILGVPIAAALVAIVALRKVVISPLGVSRRTTPAPPRALRLAPLIAGLATLGYLAASASPTTNAQSDVGLIPIFALGFLLTMIGLVVSGSWLTRIGARLLAWRTRRPWLLVAARRLSDNPSGAFRAISGLVLAVFVVTLLFSVLATIRTSLGPNVSGTSDRGVVVDQFYGMVGGDYSWTTVPAQDATSLSQLSARQGVRGVLEIYAAPGGNGRTDNDGRGPTGLVACTQLAKVPSLGRCAPGANVASITPDFFDDGQVVQVASESVQAATVWPSVHLSLARLRARSLDAVVVSTNESASAIEQVRTSLEVAFPRLALPLTMGSINPATTESLSEGQHLTEVIIFASLLIASCSLAVSVASGLQDRRHSFSLLRLSGAPLGMLRRVIAFEGVVPLVAGVVISIGAALIAGELSLKALLGTPLQTPDALFYVIVLAGVLVSLAVISSTFPLLERMTGPEEARNV